MLKEKWSKHKLRKFGRKTLIGTGICLSPVVLFMVGYYISEYMKSNKITIDTNNHIIFFTMLSFVVIIVLAQFVTVLYQNKLTKDIHEMTQILCEILLEDGKVAKKYFEQITSFLQRNGDN